MNLTEQELHILRHSLGISDAGYGKPYRNRYFNGPDADDFHVLQRLCNAGLMRDHGVQPMTCGMHYFSVTPAGVLELSKHDPPPLKLTAGQKRYKEFLRFDSSMSFGEWLKWKQRVKKGRLV